MNKKHVVSKVETVLITARLLYPWAIMLWSIVPECGNRAPVRNDNRTKCSWPHCINQGPLLATPSLARRLPQACGMAPCPWMQQFNQWPGPKHFAAVGFPPSRTAERSVCQLTLSFLSYSWWWICSLLFEQKPHKWASTHQCGGAIISTGVHTACTGQQQSCNFLLTLPAHLQPSRLSHLSSLHKQH